MRSHLLLLLAAAVSTPTAASQVIYVRASATGANDGSSWADAFTDLQSALNVDGPADQVWVAAGTYRPSATGDRTASFALEFLCEYYGGFAGTETTLEQRAGLFDATILSGDLAGDDGPGFTNVSDNSIHVVKQFGADVFDGFTVTGGNATANEGGGGMYGFPLNRSRIEDCTFRANRTDGGGGAVMLGMAFEPLIRRCTFLGNHSAWGGGALATNLIDTTGRVESCRFLGNTAAFGGAFDGQGVEFLNCEFSGNSARIGGAIRAWGPVGLLCCTVAGNSALGTSAGGVLAYGPSMRDCILWGNTNGVGGGEAAQLETVSCAWVQDCCIEGWTGKTCPEAAYVLHGDPRFVDHEGADGIVGTVDDDLRLRLGSSCVDTGRANAAWLPSRDLGGGLRFVDSLACGAGDPVGDASGVLDVLDMGAYERQEIDGTTSYCPQPPTSLGLPAEISATCVIEQADHRVLFRVGPVASTTGFLWFGSRIASVPFGMDTRCIGGETHRATMSRVGSALVLELDLAEPGAAPLVPGSTWHFQALFRDAGTLRLSDATSITFRE